MVGIAADAWGHVYPGDDDILTGAPVTAYNTVDANVVTVDMSIHF